MRGVGGGLLALLRDHVLAEGLGRVGGVLILVLVAVDVVRDQDDRVGPVGLGVAVELERHVVLGAALDALGGVDGRSGSVGAVLDVVVAHAHGHGAQIADGGGIGVGDGAVRVRGGGDHAGGALGVLLAGDRPGLGGLVRPGLGSGRVQVVGEVLGGAGLIRAVHHGDVRVRQIGIRVLLGDGRIVPGGDLAGEDARDGLGVEVQGVDALEVEADRDRGDVGGDVERALVAALLLGGLELLLVHGGIRAGEARAAGQEGLAAGAGAIRRVADLDGRIQLAGAIRPGVHGRLLRGRARALQRGRAAAAASGQCDRADGENRGALADARSLHVVPLFLWFC